MDSSNYSSWTLLPLRKELNKQSARKSGRKSDLIERLVSYQRNADFRGPVVQIPDMVPMPIWRDSGYSKSIIKSDKTSIPPITKAHIEHYVIHRQVGDDIQNLDIASMRKGEKMKETVLALSFVESKEDIQKTLFSGIIEMKNNNYNVKFVIAKSGEVV
ncbi:MKL [Lepeophtheirus salmonis]|uniref:MKL n=1 Tax=Lepeophtheirus salmonis TaxID=72036 RepID=A0A7R8CGU0_LEPSM|nr:MKL [Lepeophtheirus salmonis]CAF2761448.1 MKL [Lepeophtheirus salmonis]